MEGSFSVSFCTHIINEGQGWILGLVIGIVFIKVIVGEAIKLFDQIDSPGGVTVSQRHSDITALYLCVQAPK